MDEKVGPHSLPFDSKLLRQDIADFYNPPVAPEVESKPDTFVSSTDTSANGLDTSQDLDNAEDALDDKAKHVSDSIVVTGKSHVDITQPFSDKSKETLPQSLVIKNK